MIILLLGPQAVMQKVQLEQLNQLRLDHLTTKLK